MEDTLTMAKQAQERQGSYEVEVSFGGEADLHRHAVYCKKNPGHLKFVPVDMFTADHLPPGCQDNDLVDLVRDVSDLTVRLSVRYISESRPETFPGTDKLYPFYRGRGGDMLRMGTGLIFKVDKNRKDVCHNSGEESVRLATPKVCSCRECVQSSTPKTQFAYIHIRTATHVVFDDLEAAHTTCHLFFDRGGVPDVCDGAVALSGLSVARSDVSCDVTELRCITHDLFLADRLKKITKHLRDLRDMFYSKVRRQALEKQETLSVLGLSHSLEQLTLIVSHPHGCSKKISVGQHVDVDTMKYSRMPITYTTATCPGSSGAHVTAIIGGLLLFWWKYLIHSGCCEGKKDLNFCGTIYP